MISCGTWIDVPRVQVPPRQFDLQLLAVRFVDAGHPEQKLGPRFRVWLRNSSDLDLSEPFNVTLLASNQAELGSEYVEAGIRVEGVPGATTRSVDIRLPFEATTMGKDEQGNPQAFSHLHVIVDSHNEIEESQPENNGSVMVRGDILSVDPVLFSPEKPKVAPGETIALAGEGLGPEPGKVLMFIDDLELQPEIVGWFDLGVRVRVPPVFFAEEKSAEIVVVRGDGTATNVLPLTLNASP